MKKYELDQIENMSLDTLLAHLTEAKAQLSPDWKPREDRAYISPSILLRSVGKIAYRLARELERQDKINGGPIA